MNKQDSTDLLRFKKTLKQCDHTVILAGICMILIPVLYGILEIIKL